MSRSSGPCVTARKSAASSTLRASGPKWEIESKTVGRISMGMRPSAGFSPTMPQKDAGIRTDPPMSVPSARLTHPVATATAEPPDEPPEVRVRSRGLRVMPQSRLAVKLE